MRIRSSLIILFSLILLPFISFAAIPVPNPGGMFANADFTQILVNIVNYILAFIALLGIIFIIWGGIQYITSTGDTGKTEDAKNTIMYAAIGLLIAAMAYAIEGLALNLFIA